MTDHRDLEEVLEVARQHEGFFGEHRYPSGSPFGVSSLGASGDTPLHFYAWSNDLEAAELLLEAGANPNASGDLGETPLHVAVRKGSVEMSKLLVAWGANPDIPCGDWETPRELALHVIGGAIAEHFQQSGT